MKVVPNVKVLPSGKIRHGNGIAIPGIYWARQSYSQAPDSSAGIFALQFSDRAQRLFTSFVWRRKTMPSKGARADHTPEVYENSGDMITLQVKADGKCAIGINLAYLRVLTSVVRLKPA